VEKRTELESTLADPTSLLYGSLVAKVSSDGVEIIKKSIAYIRSEICEEE